MERGFRPQIEGLRGVAILLVVAFHVGIERFFLRFGTSHLAGGYVGVDVFFVISGFLIIGGLAREFEQRGDVDLRAFYARRIRRLVPLGTLTSLLTLAASCVLLPRIDWPSLARDGAAAAGFAANLAFAVQARTYLQGGGSDESPFLHYWSLSIEEQFYLLFPGLLLLAVRFTRSRRLELKAQLSALLVVVIALSFACSVWEVRRGGPWGYYGLHSRVWELAVGGLLACQGEAIRRLDAARARALSWFGLLAILSSVELFDATTSFPGFAALLPVLGAAAVLAAGEADASVGASRWLSGRPLVFVGGLSYAWYLLHWPFIVLIGPATWAFGRPAAPVLLAAAGMSFVAAMGFNRWFENPLRRSPTMLRGRIPLAVLGMSLVLIGLAAAGMARQPRTTGVETAATPRGARRDGPRVDPGCQHDFEGSAWSPCRIGAADGRDTLVIVGDSHALQLVPAFDSVLRQRGLRGELFFKASCPPFEVRRFLKEYRREYTECSAWRAAVYTHVAASRPRAVVLARYGGYASSLLDERGRGINPAQATTVWQAGVHATFVRLRAVGAPVFVFRDTPNPGVDVPRCVDLKGAAACGFSRAEKGRWDDVLFQAEAREAKQFDNVELVDLTDSVCPTDTCSVVQDGIIKFRDNNHLTATFARTLAPTLNAALRRAW